MVIMNTKQLLSNSVKLFVNNLHDNIINAKTCRSVFRIGCASIIQTYACHNNDSHISELLMQLSVYIMIMIKVIHCLSKTYVNT